MRRGRRSASFSSSKNSSNVPRYPLIPLTLTLRLRSSSPFPLFSASPSSTSVPPTPPTRSSLSWVRRFFRWWHCGWRSRDQCGVCERCCVFAYIGGRWRLFCRGGMLLVVRLFSDDCNGPLCGRRSCGGERLARRTTLSRRVHLSRWWYPRTSFDRKPYQNILHCSSTTTGYQHGW